MGQQRSRDNVSWRSYLEIEDIEWLVHIHVQQVAGGVGAAKAGAARPPTGDAVAAPATPAAGSPCRLIRSARWRHIFLV